MSCRIGFPKKRPAPLYLFAISPITRYFFEHHRHAQPQLYDQLPIYHRLKNLDIIRESYYKSLVIRFRQKGWHRKEPGIEIPPEKDHTFNRMLFHALAEEYIGESKAAELLSCSVTHLKNLRQVQNSHALPD